MAPARRRCDRSRRATPESLGTRSRRGRPTDSVDGRVRTPLVDVGPSDSPSGDSVLLRWRSVRSPGHCPRRSSRSARAPAVAPMSAGSADRPVGGGLDLPSAIADADLLRAGRPHPATGSRGQLAIPIDSACSGQVGRGRPSTAVRGRHGRGPEPPGCRGRQGPQSAPKLVAAMPDVHLVIQTGAGPPRNGGPIGHAERASGPPRLDIEARSAGGIAPRGRTSPRSTRSGGCPGTLRPRCPGTAGSIGHGGGGSRLRPIEDRPSSGRLGGGLRRHRSASMRSAGDTRRVRPSVPGRGPQAAQRAARSRSGPSS